MSRASTSNEDHLTEESCTTTKKRNFYPSWTNFAPLSACRTRAPILESRNHGIHGRRCDGTGVARIIEIRIDLLYELYSYGNNRKGEPEFSTRLQAGRGTSSSQAYRPTGLPTPTLRLRRTRCHSRRYSPDRTRTQWHCQFPPPFLVSGRRLALRKAHRQAGFSGPSSSTSEVCRWCQGQQR